MSKPSRQVAIGFAACSFFLTVGCAHHRGSPAAMPPIATPPVLSPEQTHAAIAESLQSIGSQPAATRERTLGLAVSAAMVSSAELAATWHQFQASDDALKTDLA